MPKLLKICLIPLLSLCLILTGCGKGDEIDSNELKLLTITSEKSAPIVNDEFQLTVTGVFNDGTQDNSLNASATWRSNNEEVATVSETGKVICLAEGQVTIIVEYNERVAEKEFTVNPIPVVSDISVTFDSDFVVAGDEITLDGKVILSNERIDESLQITWGSLNEELATIDENGKVTTLKSGVAVITATVDEVTIEFELTVIPRVTGIRMNPDPLYLNFTQQGQVSVFAQLSNDEEEEITRSVSWQYENLSDDIAQGNVIDIQRNGIIRVRDKGIVSAVASYNYRDTSFSTNQIVIVEEPIELFVAEDKDNTIQLTWNQINEVVQQDVEIPQEETDPPSEPITETVTSIEPIDEYRLYRSETPGFSLDDVEPLSIMGETDYAETEIDINKTYYYRVSFVRNEVESLPSNELEVKPHLARWKSKQRLAFNLADAAHIQHGDSLFLFGGEKTTDSTITSNETLEYNFVANTWTSNALLTQARKGASACVIDSTVYLIGGLDETGTPLASIDKYDLTVDQWFSASETAVLPQDLPVALSYTSCHVIDNLIYIVGGISSEGEVGTVYLLDPADNATPATLVASMNTARAHHASVLVNGKIYVAGGNSGGTITKTFEVYDPTLDSWQLLDKMPTARIDFDLFEYDGFIHAVGGTGNVNPDNGELTQPVITEKFSLADNVWSNGTKMPYANNQYASAIRNNTYYVFTGSPDAVAASSGIADQMQFNLVEQSWYPHPSIENGIKDYANAILNDKLYLIGGENNSGNATNLVNAFSLTENRWLDDNSGAVIDKLENSRKGAMAVTVKNTIFIMGGEGAGGTTLDTVESYDADENLWTKSLGLMKSPRAYGCAVAYQGVIYVFGGTNDDSLVNTVESFDTVTKIWSEVGVMSIARSGLSCTLLNNKIYLIGGYKLNEENQFSASDTVTAYLPTINRFENKANMKSARILPGITTYNGRIYAFSGFTGNFNTRSPLDSLEVYSPASASSGWRSIIIDESQVSPPPLTLPFSQSNSIANVFHNKIYVIGSSIGESTTRNNIFVLE